MNRYAIFAGSYYYPSGGWNDFKGSFTTERLALLYVANMPRCDWFQIVDLETGENLDTFENMSQSEVDELNAALEKF